MLIADGATDRRCWVTALQSAGCVVDGELADDLAASPHTQPRHACWRGSSRAQAEGSARVEVPWVTVLPDDDDDEGDGDLGLLGTSASLGQVVRPPTDAPRSAKPAARPRAGSLGDGARPSIEGMSGAAARLVASHEQAASHGDLRVLAPDMLPRTARAHTTALDHSTPVLSRRKISVGLGGGQLDDRPLHVRGMRDFASFQEYHRALRPKCLGDAGTYIKSTPPRPPRPSRPSAAI